MKIVTLLITLLLALVEVVYRKLMLCYFGYLLFHCLNYQPILGQCFLSLPQKQIGKTGRLYTGMKLYLGSSIRMRYVIPSSGNLSGESQKEEKVGLSVYYHMLFFEKQNEFVQHLFYLTNDDLSFNTITIADASKTQSKYVYVTRVSTRVSIRCIIAPKITLVPQ